MNKFLGILFFYTLAFYNKGIDYKVRGNYLREKSRRYLNLDITEAEWKLLKIYLKDLPIPGGKGKLSQDNLFTMIEAFDEVFGVHNIDYELRMCGIDYNDEMEIIDVVYDNLNEYIEIIGSSNGIHVGLSNWLKQTPYDRTLINRIINLIELDI